MNKRNLSKTGSLLVFRKWKNKGYAVFNSLNRVVKIAVLAVAYSIVTNPLSGFTQQIPGDTVLSGEELDEVVISADRIGLQTDESMRVVQVITREEIASLPVQHIAELIETISNADVRQRGPNGVQADIGIRGGSFNQTLILLNGVKINDPQTGHHNLNLPVELRDITRVEILEGPGARLYGGNAYSGAINFVTEPGKKSEAVFTAVAGENKYFDSGVSLRLPKNKSAHFFSVSKSYCDGYIDNTDFSKKNIFYHGKFNKLSLQTGYNASKFGATTFYSAKYPEQYEETSTYFASLKYKGGRKIIYSPVVYWRGHQDYYTLFRKTPEYYRNDHFTNVLGAEINARVFSAIGRTAFGAEIRYESILSTALGEEYGDSIRVFGAKDRYYNKKAERLNASVFVDHLYKGSNYSISGGGLLFFFENYFGFFPGLEAYIPVIKPFGIFAGVNKAFRLPTFTELYYPGLTNVGNPILKPEECITYEIGVKTQKENFQIKTAAFYRQGHNTIDWVREPENHLWESSNITELNTFGAEIIGSIKIYRLLNEFSRIRDLSFTYCYIDANSSSGQFISKYAMDYLRHKLSFSTVISLPLQLYTSISVIYSNRMGSYTDKDLNEIDYLPATLVDYKITRDINNLRLFIEVANLLNIKHTDIGAIPLPGRWVKIGLVYRNELRKRTNNH
jgi:vitamin B12 transporter